MWTPDQVRSDRSTGCHAGLDPASSLFILGLDCGKSTNLQSRYNKIHSMHKTYYVYILANKKHGTLYTGMTSNLIKRVYEHKNKLVRGFSTKYDVAKLVFFESSRDVESIIKREKQLKNWKRRWKIDLIENENPEWKDLYKEITEMDSGSSPE